MKLAEEFRQNAEEWRQIGTIAATDEHRRRISEIADTWLAWAERRERLLRARHRKAPRISEPGPTLLTGQQRLPRETDQLDGLTRSQRLWAAMPIRVRA
jgi:phage baseplate assembly protein gpV